MRFMKLRMALSDF